MYGGGYDNGGYGGGGYNDQYNQQQMGGYDQQQMGYDQQQMGYGQQQQMGYGQPQQMGGYGQQQQMGYDQQQMGYGQQQQQMGYGQQQQMGYGQQQQMGYGGQQQQMGGYQQQQQGGYNLFQASVVEATQQAMQEAQMGGGGDMNKEDLKKLIPMMILFKLIQDRNKMLATKDEKLEMVKATTKDANLLEELEDKQDEEEEQLIAKVDKPSMMTKFLKNILLIENLMNSFYTKQLQADQKKYRAEYAVPKGIEKLEKIKVKMTNNSNTFGELMKKAEGSAKYMATWIKEMNGKFEKAGIELAHPAKPNVKKAPRAFYKAYFWYTGDKSHNKLSDLLRTSFVFDSFKHLYQAYAIITDNCQVIRVKDRFNAKAVPFGYRDMLLNIRCPGVPKKMSPLICEVQLHHTCFYDNKKDSHRVYKVARLFESKIGKVKKNMAHASAKKFFGAEVGNKTYNKAFDFDDAKDDGDDDPVFLEKLEAALSALESGEYTIEQLIQMFEQDQDELGFGGYDDEYGDYDDYGGDSDWDDDFEFDEEPDDFDFDGDGFDYGFNEQEYMGGMGGDFGDDFNQGGMGGMGDYGDQYGGGGMGGGDYGGQYDQGGMGGGDYGGQYDQGGMGGGDYGQYGQGGDDDGDYSGDD